jgi:hypothetical protein
MPKLPRFQYRTLPNIRAPSQGKHAIDAAADPGMQ